MAFFPVHEDYWDRPFGGNDSTNHLPYPLICFLSGFFSVFMKVLFRFSVKNQESVRKFQGKKNGAVVVSPHVSYLDVIAMFLSVRPTQWVRLIGRDSLFEAAGGILGRILSHAGAFPIKRDEADRVALKRAARMLKNGELVGIFPEGTRRGKGGRIPALHGGAALIARMGKAPLLPLGLRNIDQVKQKGKFFRFPKITAVFGEPVALSSFDFLPKDERLDACTWYVMREAFALSRDVSPTEVNMKELFPESKDYTDIFAEHPIERFAVEDAPDYQAQ